MNKLILKGSEDSVKYLQELFESGELSKLLNVTIISVKEVPETELLKEVKESIVHLKQWLENSFTEGWKAVEEVLAPQQLSPAVWSESAPVKRAKQYQLGENLVNLVVEVTEDSEESVSIFLKVYPSEDKGFLPEKLRLIISADGEELPAISSQVQTSRIEDLLKAKYDEEFSLTLKLEEYSITEEFKV